MLQIETGKKNKILRTVSEVIKTNELNTYIKIGREMIKYIKDIDNKWVWLAAPQIWHNKKLIVVSLLKNWEDENFPTVMMINPEILSFSQETEIDNEWCLSLPGKKWGVERYLSVKLSYIDERKKKNTFVFTGASARIIQHEIDHLNGILFTDRVIEK